MNTVRVSASKAYDVHIGRGILDSCGGMAAKRIGPCKAMIVTDTNVRKLYADRVAASFAAQGFEVHTFVFLAGEASKNMQTYEEILHALALRQFTRSDIVVALGGGVCGDITGFAAATYLRGVRLIQMPTTFLAAIDSSVGGKTGLDLPMGKNLVGAFYQPDLVICDLDVFDTLPKQVFLDGAAEAVKYGVIAGGTLFDIVSKGEYAETIMEVVTACVDIKRGIVTEDEFDIGARKVLNLGHTVGHCIEKLSGYTITHGHAVAMGMAVIARAAQKNGMSACKERIVSALCANGLPHKTEYGAKEIFNCALLDKKRNADQISLVIPAAIGRCEIVDMSIDRLCAFIEQGLEDV